MKTLKRYSKVTIKCVKKKIHDDRKFYFYDRTFVSNQSLSAEHVKNV